MSETEPRQEANPFPPARRQIRQRSFLGGVALAVLVAGAAAGAGGVKLAQRWQPQSVMLLQPTAINQLREGNPSAAKGNVAEIFGNKFILDDGSGRALVDLGPRGERADAVVKGETVTVQGMFDGGIVRARIISHADGRNEAFGPPGPPPPRRAEAPPPPPEPPPPPRADLPPPPPGAPPPPPASNVPPAGPRAM